jgi:glucose-6-phosphate-specific signal transduction histidine kinase
VAARAKGWVQGPLFGVQDLGLGDVALGVGLTVFAVLIVTHGTSGGRVLDAGWQGAVTVPLMTLPVVFARRYPLAAATALLGGVLVNWGAIGHYVRCGAALPAAFFVAFVIGSRCHGKSRLLGELIVAAGLVCQSASDPQLYPVSNAPLFIVISLVFFGLGYVAHRRNVAVTELRARTAELREQRDLNAQLAVTADRARIAHDLDGYLHDQVTDIASMAAAGKMALAAEPVSSRAAFSTIQETGRATLTHMRDVVRNLHEPVPTEPQPVLAQLDHLIGKAQYEGVHLQFNGDPRRLSPGLELSGYRVVEHLLTTLADAKSESTVAVTFGDDSLEIKVSGASVTEGAARASLSAALERAALHGGTLSSNVRNGLRETVVLIPLGATGV